MQTQTIPSMKDASAKSVGLPKGTETQKVAFVSGNDPAPTTLVEFKEPRLPGRTD